LRAEDIVPLVRDALANYYDPVHLQTHELGVQLRLGSGGTIRAEELRKALWDAVEALRPGPAVPTESNAWLTYRLLWQHYVQGQGREAICAELGLGQRTFYRRLQEATEAVASVLVARCGQRQQVSVTGANGQGDLERAAAQAIALAQHSRLGLIDIAAVAQEACQTVAPLADQVGRSVTLECQGDLPQVQGDAALYHQAFVNLLAEALKTTATGPVVLRGCLVGEQIRFELAGFPASWEREAILRLDGVSVSGRLLAAFGGELCAQAGHNAPTLLWLVIPAVYVGRLLVIDDDEDTTALYRRFLQPHGYFVAGARTPEEVDRLLQDALPDLVLLDVLMPGLDGWRMMRRLQDNPRTARLPIVICSVLAQPRLALALGAVDVLHKPLTEQTLLAAVLRSATRPGSQDRAHPAAPASI